MTTPHRSSLSLSSLPFAISICTQFVPSSAQRRGGDGGSGWHRTMLASASHSRKPFRIMRTVFYVYKTHTHALLAHTRREPETPNCTGERCVCVNVRACARQRGECMRSGEAGHTAAQKHITSVRHARLRSHTYATHKTAHNVVPLSRYNLPMRPTAHIVSTTAEQPAARYTRTIHYVYVSSLRSLPQPPKVAST